MCLSLSQTIFFLSPAATWTRGSAVSVEDALAVNDMTRRAASVAESHAGFRSRMEHMVWAYYAIFSVFCLVPLFRLQYRTGHGDLVGSGDGALMPALFIESFEYSFVAAVTACVVLRMTMLCVVTSEAFKFKGWSRLKIAAYLLKIEFVQIAFTAAAVVATHYIRASFLRASLDLLTTFGQGGSGGGGGKGDDGGNSGGKGDDDENSYYDVNRTSFNETAINTSSDASQARPFGF